MNDRGSVTIWMLGLVMIVMAIGGLALDFWRILDEKQRLEVLADTAAASGAAMLDEAEYRATGRVLLVPGDAERRAASALAATPAPAVTSINADPTQITVTLRNPVELSLLSILLPAEDAVTVQGAATARPTLHP